MSVKQRLLFELGRGGMGAVYLAVSEGPGGFQKLKVIKRLRAELAQSPDAVAMFLDEARLSARLRHPNIVQTNEVGFEDGHYFFEMEYLEGQPLNVITSAARERGGVPLRTMVWILAQALAGLDYAHKLADIGGKPLRLVHRDISPHNLFVTYEGEVKLLDFGIAKAADSSTQTESGVFKGKIAYMAPEQAIKNLFPMDHRADLFSVGVILWQTITGRRLWEDASDFDIFKSLGEGKIPSAPVTAEADAHLAAICTKALAHDPANRYANAADFREALEDWLEATVSRRGVTRELKALMDELFAAKRAETAALVETRVNAPPADVSGPVPALEAQAPGTDARARTHTAATVSTRNERSTARTGLSTRARVVAAVALAVIAVPIGWYGWRKHQESAAATAAAANRSCYSNADCAAAGADRVCAADGACVTRKGCATTAECVTAAGGQASVCGKDDGRCAPVASEDCRIYADPGDVANEHTLWIGAMFPLSGTNSAFGAQLARAADLARRDIAQVAHGVPAPRTDLPPRPLALVVCDDDVNGARAAHHLVDDVHVPAVIGFGSSQEALDLLPGVMLPKRVLSVVAINHAAAITSLVSPPGQPRLVWRLTSSTVSSTAPMARVVSDLLEPRLRRSLSASEPIRVAFVRPNAVVDASFGDALFRVLRFNGKSALENRDRFREITYADAEPAEAAKIVSSLREFSPHVVLVDDSREFVLRQVISQFEKKWRGDGPRPVYVWNGVIEGANAFKIVYPLRDAGERFLGLQPQSTTVANARFTLHYNEAYAPDHVDAQTSPGAPYDAVFTVAYAAAALGDGPATGSELATRMPHLMAPSPLVDVGPAQLLDGFRALSEGRDIGLSGAETRMHLDPKTGEPAVDFELLCVSLDRSSKTAVPSPSGVVFHSDTGQLEGTLSCRGSP